METSGSDQWTAGAYMIPQLGSSMNSMAVPTLQEIDTMGNEVISDYMMDQNLYYPPPNYYGYVYTGFESPGEWDDHYRYFGVDGQDLHYQGIQNEALQYAYYTPSGYAQSPYNPYNSYVPAVIGPDGSAIGTQQYVNSSAYQHPIISPGYIPVLLQPGVDMVPSISADQSFINSSGSMANRLENQVHYTVPSSSINSAMSYQKEPAQMSTFQNQLPPKSSEGSQAYKKNMVPGNMPSSSVPQNSQGRTLPMPVPTSDKFTQGNEIPQHASLKVSVPSHSNLSDIGSNSYGWVALDAMQQRVPYSGYFKNGTGASEVLGEKNRGPRASRSKTQWTPILVCKAYTTKAGIVDAEGNITINASQYNRMDFPVSYPNAKFFVIKSYSEDDVHKSIKYNVWSSTPNGNRRLDAAYEEARRVSGGISSNCPVFLFFSVNASGQFCGVAEMMGPVDFNKDMDFWQQDKWSGSFPVKWHIIKDVPNTSFRHIILENNENKPVTNSRDTQEIMYIPGLNMLTIFKDSLLRTCILDDFLYYEDRQKIIYHEKIQLLGRSYEQSTMFFPASYHPVRQYVTIKEPQKAEGKTIKQNEAEETKNTIVQAKEPHMVEGKPGRQVNSEETRNAKVDNSQTKKSPMVDNQAKESLISEKPERQISVEGTKVATIDNQVPLKSQKSSATKGESESASGASNGKTPEVTDVGASESKKINGKAEGGVDSSNGKVDPDSSVKKEHDCSTLSNAEEDNKSTQCSSDTCDLVKFSSPSVDKKEAEAAVAANDSSSPTAYTSNVVNFGSVPVKVNGFVADTFTVGTIPIDTTKAMEQSRQNAAG